MKTILMALLLVSAVLSQGIDKYDTTITLMAARPDSFYIYPINQYLYFNAVTTASCPAYTSADFVEFVRPNSNAKVERIPAQAHPLIRVATHCAGSEATGIKAEKVFSIEDRYYKISSGGNDIYFRVKDISNDYKARIEFSNSPYSTGIIYNPRNYTNGAKEEKLTLETEGEAYLINGKKVRKKNWFVIRK